MPADGLLAGVTAKENNTKNKKFYTFLMLIATFSPFFLTVSYFFHIFAGNYLKNRDRERKITSLYY